MAYDPETGVLTAPVGFASIHSAVGAASNDLASLCTSVNINKYAKNHPFVYPAVGFVSLATQQTAAASVDFGLIPTYFVDLASFRSGFTTAWGYTKPTGGANSPYRAGDFRNYISTARTIEEWGLSNNTPTSLFAPFGVHLDVGDTTIGLNFNITLEIIKSNMVYDSYLLYLNDFTAPKAAYGNVALSTFYLGLALINTAGTVCYTYITSAIPTVDDYQYFAIPVSGIAEDTYNIVPILSSVQNASQAWYSGIPYNAVIVNVDGKYLSSITYDESHVGPVLIIGYSSVVVDENAGTSTVTISINNPTSESKTVNDLFLYIESEYIVDWEPALDAQISDAVAEYVPSGTKYTSGIIDSETSTVIAAYYSLYALLLAANSNSNIIAPHHDLQFTLVINAVVDALGHPYNQDALLHVLGSVGGVRKIF